MLGFQSKHRKEKGIKAITFTTLIDKEKPRKNQFESSKGRQQQEIRLKVILRRIFSGHQLQLWTGFYLLTLN